MEFCVYQIYFCKPYLMEFINTYIAFCLHYKTQYTRKTSYYQYFNNDRHYKLKFIWYIACISWKLYPYCLVNINFFIVKILNCILNFDILYISFSPPDTYKLTCMEREFLTIFKYFSSLTRIFLCLELHIKIWV